MGELEGATDSTFFAVSKGTELNKVYKDSLTGAFEQRYNEICLQAYRYESFTVSHTKNEYHYTLYYYDQAGNLVRTVPPAGVQANHDSVWLAKVRAARAAGEVLVPAHTLVTNYRYNTLNQVVAQHTPDGGLSHFWYDRLGRLAVSQNAKQYSYSPPNGGAGGGRQYSYTIYDTIGRITEVGQLESDTVMADSISRSQAGLQQWIAAAYTTAEQITRTIYDYEYLPLEPVMAAKNLRNRVAWTALYNTAADVANDSAATATYYSYDVLGNVDTLVQDYRWGVMAENGSRFKKIVYEYDLISGKVNKVAYQPGQPDAFYHVYFYDAENRITHVQTSADSINWDNDAFYQYYDHGPLARTILGEQQVQGINYAYTLHGWLKAINPVVHTAEGYTLQPDGSSGSVVAGPAYDILLNYYNSEYAAISGATPMDDGLGSTLGTEHRPLFNGNISSMGVNIAALTNPLLYNYQYDQLNRLVKMDAWHKTGSAWSNLSALADFGERISYDPNGNILGYKRNGNNTFAGRPVDMDSLSYKYITGTNQLEYVRDSVPARNYSVDIDNQDTGNYGYDAIGNMTSDEAEGISNIGWTVYGKISHIIKTNGTDISYTYDAAGNRISKRVSSGDTTTTTWYVRDAQGNTMSVYTAGNDSMHNGDLTQTELHLYGSSRLGMMQRSTNLQNLAPMMDTILPLLGTGYSVTLIRGNKLFELSNHLGNVLVTISDKKFGVSEDDSTVNYFEADVVSAQDYYPFGMLMVGREFDVKDYRFGFNGQELNNEVKGRGNSYTAEFWEYDPRLGKRWNLDPKPTIGLSEYSAFANNPIFHVDIRGDTIFRPAWMKNTFENPLKEVLYRTPLGKQLLDEYSKSTSENIYFFGFDEMISKKSKSDGHALMITLNDLSTKDFVNSNGEIVFENNVKVSPNIENHARHINVSGFNLKTNAKLNFIGLNMTDDGYLKLDKYDLAFIMYHEIYAHVKLGKSIPSSAGQHKEFGNYFYTPGLGLHNDDIVGGTIVVKGSEAWKIFKQILELKVKNGDATTTNKSDLKLMNQVDQELAENSNQGENEEKN